MVNWNNEIKYELKVEMKEYVCVREAEKGRKKEREREGGGGERARYNKYVKCGDSYLGFKSEDVSMRKLKLSK